MKTSEVAASTTRGSRAQQVDRNARDGSPGRGRQRYDLRGVAAVQTVRLWGRALHGDRGPVTHGRGEGRTAAPGCSLRLSSKSLRSSEDGREEPAEALQGSMPAAGSPLRELQGGQDQSQLSAAGADCSTHGRAARLARPW